MSGSPKSVGVAEVPDICPCATVSLLAPGVVGGFLGEGEGRKGERDFPSRSGSLGHSSSPRTEVGSRGAPLLVLSYLSPGLSRNGSCLSGSSTLFIRPLGVSLP